MLRRRQRVDPEIEKALSGDMDDMVTFLESEPGAANRLLHHLCATKKMYELDTILEYPSSSRFFLRPPSHVENDVFQAMSRISPAHRVFAFCWKAARYKVDNESLFEEEHEKALKAEARLFRKMSKADWENHRRTPTIRWLGGERVWVKVEDIANENPRREVDLWTTENEETFSQASMALALTGLSDGAIPFSCTVSNNTAMINTSVDCGDPIFSATHHVVDIVYQSVMALWALRAYTHVLHLDAHLKNFVYADVSPRDLVWAWSYDTGLDRHVSMAQDHILGLMLPQTEVRVVVIDGGWSSTVEQGRKKHQQTFPDRMRCLGWDQIDTRQTLRFIGLDVIKGTREIVENKLEFIPILYFEDIPDAAIDLISFFSCMYARGDPTPDQVSRDNCLEILGCIVRLAKQDPELGHEAMVELMVRIHNIVGGLKVVEGRRKHSYTVVPMPPPGPEVDD